MTSKPQAIDPSLNKRTPILVTGVAGFIGYHVAERLLAENSRVIGVDNLNAYYDVSLKEARLSRLQGRANFHFHRLDITDSAGMAALFESHQISHVLHMAAQAGVRYSLENPQAYVDSNIVGFLNILEACRHNKIRHLIFASSSSVYGSANKQPFSVVDKVDQPISLYAATKKSNELMAHAYAHLYSLPCTGLRFFTVYGPWGRPDMAYFKFADAIKEGRPIDVYNYGKSTRDFTYIDDVVEVVSRLIKLGETGPIIGRLEDANVNSSSVPYKIYNVGGGSPSDLSTLIQYLEAGFQRKVKKNMLENSSVDMEVTHADVTDLRADISYQPKTQLHDGIKQFIAWYRDYYGV